MGVGMRGTNKKGRMECRCKGRSEKKGEGKEK